MNDAPSRVSPGITGARLAVAEYICHRFLCALDSCNGCEPSSVAVEHADTILALCRRGVAQGSQVPSKFSPGGPVEVRKVADEIDEIVIRRGDVHIEQMDDSGWFMGVDASDGSYWQFWFGAKNRKSHVHFRHTETVSSTPRATLIDHSDEECPNFPGCHCVNHCCDGWKHPAPEDGPMSPAHRETP